MSRLLCLFIIALLWTSCATPGQVGVKTPQSNVPDYPPTLDVTPPRQQAGESAWRALAQEHQLPDTLRCDCDPVLLTPRALPVEAAGRIPIVKKEGFTDLELKEALRHFIEIHARLLGVNAGDTAIGQPELSLVTLSHEGALTRVVYQQRSFAYPLAEGFGKLEFIVSKSGHLLQWHSSLLPNVTLPARATLEASALPERFVNREFTYTNIAGQPLRYRVARTDEVFVKEIVVYPRAAASRLTIHLAYPIVVGLGTTWTVYVDAVTGEELAVKSNFVS
ncbi:MAG: hypothetical protein HOP19_10885 [Acidobacteria bacterium]|nr:hypothetical protein [Acidobacteriota bacterium]